MTVALHEHAIIFKVSTLSVHYKPLLHYIENCFEQIQYGTQNIIIRHHAHEEVKKKYLLSWAVKNHYRHAPHLGAAFEKKVLEVFHKPLYILIKQEQTNTAPSIKPRKNFHTLHQEQQQSLEQRYKEKLQKCYQILGIGDHSSLQEMKKNYRKMLKKYHPDSVFNQSPDVIQLYTRRFQLVQHAFDFVKTHYHKRNLSMAAS